MSKKKEKGTVCNHCGLDVKQGMLVGTMFEHYGFLCNPCTDKFDAMREKHKKEITEFFPYKKK